MKTILLFTLLFSFNSIALAGDHKGLYTYISAPHIPNSNPRMSEILGAIAKPGIDGVVIKFGWDYLEPTPNNYDWIKFDRWVSAAVTNKKKISLGIVGGGHTPEWLFKAPFNAPFVNLKSDRSNGRGTDLSQDCIAIKMPLYWNAKYKNRYLKMYKAVRDHLRSLKIEGFPVGAAMRSVKVLKLTGINIKTTELRVPVDNRCMKNSKALADAGFDRSKIVSAWTQISKGLNDLFPNRRLALSVIQGDSAFPRFDSSGKTYTINGPFHPITRDIVKKGRKLFNKRFLAQWDGLSSFKIPLMDELMRMSNGPVSWQLNQRTGKGSACGRNFVPCDIGGMRKLMRLGFGHYKADYLEVHTIDAANFPASLFQEF